MKKFILIFITCCGAFHSVTQAQDTTRNSRRNYTHDRDLSRWVLDVNFLGGGYMQNLSASGSNAGYLKEITSVSNNGNLNFKNGYSLGGDAQVGFFFGKNKHWGIGTGFMYLSQQGDATLDNFHVEYQSTDGNGKTFRQLLTGNQIQEHITSTNLNIPLVLKYKNRFSKHWGFTADAGALFNVQMKNSYNTKNSSFDYEAVYAYGEGNVPYFDATPTPLTTDFLITRAQYTSHNSDGNVQTYFNNMNKAGYNVGLGVKPASTTGSESYTTGSIGLLLQPSVNYFFSDVVALNVGVYYIYQPFKNSADANYMLTNKTGEYSSVLNNVSSSNAQSYGLNLGLRFFLGKSAPPMAITGTDVLAPTLCGTCDGVVTLHGLKAGKNARVDYDFNGVKQTTFDGKVDGSGNIILTGLCAGNYTNITARVGRHSATTFPVNVVAPALVISSEDGANATATGKCDATITFSGLYKGKQVTINYNLNGVAQPAYTATVAANSTVVITGLCAGNYTGFVAAIGSCTANGQDITLTAPAPPPPPVETPAPEADNDHDEHFSPILFDVNKTTIHKSSLPEIERAAKDMKSDKDAVLIIDGNADITGKESVNRVLSLERANSVKKQLTKRGVNPKRIKTRGHGSKVPVASNKTKAGKQLNRRAELKIAPNQK
jgi:outer membrane protein OmpA-like peptidoglycan-associated protein